MPPKTHELEEIGYQKYAAPSETKYYMFSRGAGGNNVQIFKIVYCIDRWMPICLNNVYSHVYPESSFHKNNSLSDALHKCSVSDGEDVYIFDSLLDGVMALTKHHEILKMEREC